MKAELKNFLWMKDFGTLITKYADEEVRLVDEGDSLKRIEALPFQEMPGMRIQVFAGSDMKNAELKAREVSSLGFDTVYIIEETGLYKVQVGNFLDRREAEIMLDKLRFAEISNAWITQSSIQVPKDSSQLIEQKSIDYTADTFKITYSIQVFVTGNKKKANQLTEKFSSKFNDKAWVIQQGNFWKILLGKFTSEESARLKLKEIRKSGFADAWLTQSEE
jgi:cell division septation protein DedD